VEQLTDLAQPDLDKGVVALAPVCGNRGLRRQSNLLRMFGLSATRREACCRDPQLCSTLTPIRQYRLVWHTSTLSVGLIWTIYRQSYRP